MAVRATRTPISRGCGERKKGGVYMCTGTSERGLPIEAFLIDPARQFDVECFRAPIVVADPSDPNLKHVAIWVGREHYPSLVDYVEETRRLGASRRIPQDFDFSVLTPNRSRMILIHPLAYTQRIDKTTCPHDREDEGHGEIMPCVGAHWSYVEALGSEVTTSGELVKTVRIGQSRYHPAQEQIAVDAVEFSPGAFLQLPITHIEYQANDRNDAGPSDVDSRAHRAGFDYVIVDDIDTTA